MSEEEIKKVARETFLENVMKNFDSVVIFEYIQTLERENAQLKKSLENAQDIYKNSHKYTSECEDKVIELKSVLKEIRELVESYNLGKYDYSIPPIGISDLLEIIDKGIGEDK